ncbi:hypothetical protein HDV04_002663 [Boothiomyces sp. JEL0838]|nr:hypothetical protein HDV04_002663 [Boothiomyces sp. JEL0838]
MDLDFEFEIVQVEHQQDDLVEEGFRLFNTAPQKIKEEEEFVIAAPEREYEIVEDNTAVLSEVAVTLDDIMNEAKAYKPQWVDRVISIPERKLPSYPKRKSKFNRKRIRESYQNNKPKAHKPGPKKFTEFKPVKKERHRKKK